MLELRDIYKAFDGKSVLRGVSLAANEGEIVALLGPSGCGKTTILRIVAGLETADQGEILLDGVDLTQVPIHKRRFGMVFQDYALFPHKNVEENVAFGLRMLNWKRERIDERFAQVLKLVGLQEFGGRSVHELSGGEQQRVSLARALAPYPRVLLLDEPLASLDRALRERLMNELRSILIQAGSVRTETGAKELPYADQGSTDTMGQESMRGPMTSIYVTHDQEEAFAIADRIFVMNEGRIEQSGTPMDLYKRPETVFVARFLGMDNLLSAEIAGTNPPTIRCALGELSLSRLDNREDEKLNLLIRPKAAELTNEHEAGGNIVRGQLKQLSFRGRHQIAVSRPTPDSLGLLFHRGRPNHAEISL
jgi:ABC-type Fe3+/spermidine/putrescine transport system ATPase subunit